MSLLDRRLRASFKLAEDNAHLDDVESSVPSRQVLQDSYELLVRARDQDSIVGASATVKSPDLLVQKLPSRTVLTGEYRYGTDD